VAAGHGKKAKTKEGSMFAHLTNLNVVRSVQDSIGFFIFHTILLVGISTFLVHYLPALGVISGDVGSFFEGGPVHTLIGTGWVMILSSMILSGKKLTNDMMSVIIALVGIYLSYTVDVMLGMVVVAYLTTLKK
jgi:hypothetical protein